VRAQYPLLPRGFGPGGDRTGCQPPPAGPTDAAPGSVEKIAVLTERARRREQLHHPQDVCVALAPAAALDEVDDEAAREHEQERRAHVWGVLAGRLEERARTRRVALG
jgi:hypothetical protein